MSLEVYAQHMNFQLNGVVWLIDWSGYPYWLITQGLSPIFLKNVVQSAMLSTPVKIKGIIFLNCPIYAYTAWNILKPFVPAKIRKRFKLYRGEWKSLFDIISKDLMPTEYGGTARSVEIGEVYHLSNCVESTYSHSNMDSECSTSNSATNDSQENNCQQLINDVKKWIETEAPFYGRTDEDFILMFLRSCYFKLELTKQTLTYYYENRRDIPQWWTNRNLNDQKLRSILYDKLTVTLPEIIDKYPTVLITSLTRLKDGVNTFDSQFQLGSILLETVMRRKNVQLNGAIWLLDVQNYSWWFMMRCMHPQFLKNFIHSYYLSAPIRVQAVVIINVPLMAHTVINSAKVYLDEEMQKRIYVYGSDWMPAIYDHISKDILPTEYGGNSGPLETHAAPFIDEVLAYNDSLVEDSKFGFL
ncbi:hypothetical protein CHUAL_001136 [Chamberlinius hualienensis]